MVLPQTWSVGPCYVTCPACQIPLIWGPALALTCPPLLSPSPTTEPESLWWPSPRQGPVCQNELPPDIRSLAHLFSTLLPIVNRSIQRVIFYNSLYNSLYSVFVCVYIYIYTHTYTKDVKIYLYLCNGHKSKIKIGGKDTCFQVPWPHQWASQGRGIREALSRALVGKLAGA